MAARKSKPRHKTTPPLSVKQIRFAQLCVERGQVYRSYLDAGLPPGPDEQATRMRASRMVRNRYVWEYIQHLRHVAAEAAKVSVEGLVATVANLMLADRRGLFDCQGRMLPPHRWPDDVAATVEAIEMADPKGRGKAAKAAGVKKVKTASRLAAAVKLMEWKGMLRPEKGDAAPAGAEKADVRAYIPDNGRGDGPKPPAPTEGGQPS
jgi:hypothetical protein